MYIYICVCVCVCVCVYMCTHLRMINNHIQYKQIYCHYIYAARLSLQSIKLYIQVADDCKLFLTQHYLPSGKKPSSWLLSTTSKLFWCAPIDTFRVTLSLVPSAKQ